MEAVKAADSGEVTVVAMEAEKEAVMEAD